MNARKATGLANRPKNTPENPAKDEVRAEIRSTKDQEIEIAKASLMLSPSASAAVATAPYLMAFGEVDIRALMHNLSNSMERVHGGDLKDAESMLIGQAHALQAIFMHLANRSAHIKKLKQYELDLRLALKAQAQCCRTLEVLAALKNPPVVLARQANVTTGPQQINNGIPAAPGSPHTCAETKPQQNELLENNYVERLDTGAQSQASQRHTPLEAVGAINRPAKR